MKIICFNVLFLLFRMYINLTLLYSNMTLPFHLIFQNIRRYKNLDFYIEGTKEMT
jgi:hypothetical protein